MSETPSRGRKRPRTPGRPAKRSQAPGRPSKQQRHSAGNIVKFNAERARQNDEEKFEELYLKLKADLKPTPGEFYSASANKVLLRLLINSFLDALTEDPATDPSTTMQPFLSVEEQTGTSYKTLKSIWIHFSENWQVPEPTKRGRKPVKVYSGKQLSPHHVIAIIKWAREFHENGSPTTSKKLRSKLQEEFGIRISKRALIKVLQKCGFKWSPAKKRGFKLKISKEHLNREFFRLLSEALKLEESGDYIIVYTDESYCHQRHSANFTWCNEAEGLLPILLTGSGKGARFVLLHALCKNGLLSIAGHERVADDCAEKAEEKEDMNTAEWVFEGPVKKGDYHKNMNSKNFMYWVKHRLIPTFELQFPSKKMVLVLDNAPYHHARGDGCIVPSQLNRQDLFDVLVERARVERMSIQRGETVVDFELSIARKYKRGGKNSPTVKELRAELTEWCNQHPEVSKTELQKTFENRDWRLIFTPPYMPQFQPVEMLWACTKSYVARSFTTGRTKNETRQAILDGFYGHGDHKGVGKALCTALIEKCLQACNEHIHQDELLAGHIRDLKVLREENADEKVEMEEEELEEETNPVDNSDMYFGSGGTGDDFDAELDRQSDLDSDADSDFDNEYVKY